MSLAGLTELLRDCERLFVITGAGMSAPSGIATYRDDAGVWQHSAPMQHADFLHSPVARQRYWARSLIGWPAFRDAAPNAGHRALAQLEGHGRLRCLVTQNVDGLHQAAGQHRLIELHGNLGWVRCLACERRVTRAAVQDWLADANPGWISRPAQLRPDGDAALATHERLAEFRVPECSCGGLLKPDVVFYGDSVPRGRVDAVYQALGEADAVLVVGSSLMVYSAYRFVKAARAQRLPMAAINPGVTRADDFFDVKWAEDGSRALPALVGTLC